MTEIHSLSIAVFLHVCHFFDNCANIIGNAEQLVSMLVYKCNVLPGLMCLVCNT